MVNIEILKKAKKEKKMTFEQLSDKSGVPLSTLYDLFRGVTTAPRIDTMQAIESALGIRDSLTNEERAAGAVHNAKISVDPDELAWLHLRDEIIAKMGIEYLNTLIKLLEKMIEKN